MRVGPPRDQAAAKRGTVRNREGGWGGGGWCNDHQRYEDDNQHQEPANAQRTLC